MAYKNIDAIFSYANSQNILLDKEEFQFQVETHPDYPSLLAFADAFSFFKIPNIATKIYADQIESLPNSFVALFEENGKEDLAYFTEKNGKYEFTHEKQTKKIDVTELKQYWKDIVFLVEKPEGFDDVRVKDDVLKNILFIFFAFVILGIIYWFSKSNLMIILSITSILGIFLSTEALKIELGIESKVSKNMCNIVSNSDCSQVINSNKKTWLKQLKISDISIWFFGSQLLSLLLLSIVGAGEIYISLIFLVLALSTPITLYSIYFQYKIEKKWCPICLSIITLVYIQLFLSATKFVYPLDIYYKYISLFIFSFLLIAFSVYLTKPFLLTLKSIKAENITNLRFKKNYSVFKNILKKQEQHIFQHENLILGNSNSDLKISVVTSPYCGYCKEAHEILHEILKNNLDNLCISIRFNYKENFDNKSRDLFCRLVEIHQEKGDYIFLDALQNWFENKNINNWLLDYGQPKNNEIVELELLKVANENELKNLNFTPNIFINEYKFPELYERKNLEFFIIDLIDDQEL